MRIFAGLLVAVLAIVVSPVTARADGGFQKGDWSLTLSGGGASTKDFDDSSFTLTAAPSYFLTNEFELGVRQTVAYSDGFNGITEGFVNYNFKLQNTKLVPYVGLSLGYSYGEDVKDTVRLAPEAGLKYFVNDTTYLYGRVAYQFDIDDGFDNGGFVYGVGIGFRF